MHMRAGMAVLLWALGSPTAATIQVGPTRTYKTPSQALAVARDGDVVEIDAGLYSGDVATWTASNLTLRGVGGRAHLAANGKHAQGKAIWVIAGANTVVENIEFSGCTVPSQNGAGIRQEGPGLTVRNCFFHDNENGLLTSNHATSDIVVERSEFARNGFGDGFTHNIYVNHVRSFTLRHSYVHHAKVGHNVKSRASRNLILYNRIMDEATGTSSYAIDLPNGGDSYVIGNLIQKGPAGSNDKLVSYAAEGGTNPLQQLYCVNNTMVNDDPGGGTFVRLSGSPTAKLINNLFVGPGAPVSGNAQLVSNLVTSTPGLVNRAAYDYQLAAGSPAIDAGSAPGTANGISLTPVQEYVHALGSRARTAVGPLDVGAYEFGSSGGGGTGSGGGGTGSGGGGTGGGTGTGGGGTVGGTPPAGGPGRENDNGDGCGLLALEVLAVLAGLRYAARRLRR